jgi:hypothetical protein
MGGQDPERVEGASRFERSGALEVLALEEHTSAGHLTERPRRHEWSVVDVSTDPLPRIADSRERDLFTLTGHARDLNQSAARCADDTGLLLQLLQ